MSEQTTVRGRKHRAKHTAGRAALKITDEARPATFVVDARNEHGEKVATAIAGEHPLTIYLDKREIVTLMTLGQAPEALALGYLRNQRMVHRIEDVVSVQVDWETGACAVTTAAPSSGLAGRLRKRTVTTGCGQGTVFGDLMDEIDQVELSTEASIDTPGLYALLDAVRLRETVYKQAGAVHGCALARDGNILYFVEDVGRHNAVDAIAGLMWLDDVQGDDKVFYTTGRLTSEMVIKCAQMQVPILVSRSGLTHMGWEVAQKIGLTMIGRAKGKHFLLFTGRERFAE
ncbi:MAG: formate dehydrogenase accessory sulfurtransferase FdhD [Betaproteobacteria bacterium]|nr:MAG: formate dehydrogenase accessory sulfurtransferase FdhD [Betaproteobacteria bacterium]